MGGVRQTAIERAIRALKDQGETIAGIELKPDGSVHILTARAIVVEDEGTRLSRLMDDRMGTGSSTEVWTVDAAAIAKARRRRTKS